MNPSNPFNSSQLGPDPAEPNPCLRDAQEHLTPEDLDFLRTTRGLSRGARPAFLRDLHAQVELWAGAEPVEAGVSGAQRPWSSAPRSSRSGRFLRQAVAVYMGVAAALVAFALLRGSDSFAMKEPSKQAIATPSKGR